MGFFLSIPIILLLIVALFVVKQQTSAIIERFGRFQSIRNAGLQIRIPFVDRIAGRVSLKIQQLDVIVETKTKDDVFVKLKVSVQYHILKDKVYDAFYRLENPHDQITSYVFDVVRAEVPKMKLDYVFEKKDDIAIAIKSELSDAMNEYGYGIIKALVTDIDPDEEVKVAMNRINAAEREKTAAQFEGDAERIKIVEKARQLKVQILINRVSIRIIAFILHPIGLLEDIENLLTQGQHLYILLSILCDISVDRLDHIRIEGPRQSAIGRDCHNQCLF